MRNMAAKISDDTQVAMPLRNILSIVGGVAIATWEILWYYRANKQSRN